MEKDFGKLTDQDRGAGDLDDEEWDDMEEEFNQLDPITAEEWSETHPANLICGSDKYYAELANELAEMIFASPLQIKDKDLYAREIGKVLAAYMEDVVGELKVFSAMRRVCMRQYGYQLPFYDCNHDGYMLNHLNIEDIQFLLWQTSCRIGKSYQMTFSPLAPGWKILGEQAFDLMNDRFEEAPEPTRLKDWLRRSLRKETYLDIREIASWLVFLNPLTYFHDYLENLKMKVFEACTQKKLDMKYLGEGTYDVIVAETWQRSMSAVGCPSRTLTAALAEEFGFESVASDIEAIEVIPKQVYRVSQDKKSRKIFFENSNHQILEVRKDSFAKGFRPAEMGYAACTLVKYKDSYLLNGMLSGNEELKSIWERYQPSFTSEEIRKGALEWIDKLDGRQVVCVANPKTLYKKLDLPNEARIPYEEATNYIVLISTELGLTILPGMGYAFALPNNRFYRKRAAAMDSFGDLVYDNAIPNDVALYIQEQHLLPEACVEAFQGKETGHRVVQDYLAFWIGFYRRLPSYAIRRKIVEED